MEEFEIPPEVMDMLEPELAAEFTRVAGDDHLVDYAEFERAIQEIGHDEAVAAAHGCSPHP